MLLKAVFLWRGADGAGRSERRGATKGQEENEEERKKKKIDINKNISYHKDTEDNKENETDHQYFNPLLTNSLYYTWIPECFPECYISLMEIKVKKKWKENAISVLCYLF